MAAGRKIKYITLASLFAISLSIGIGYASWQFNDSQSSSLNNNVGINSWRFSQALPIEPGQTIDIASDGTVSIDGEVIEDADIEYPGGAPETGGGQVSMKIGVDEEGNLVVSEYSATNIGSELFNYTQNLTFPQSISIDGNEYKILGISEPITLSARGAYLFGDKTLTINVPEGYEYVCDGVFESFTFSNASNLNVVYNLPSSLAYLGNNAFNFATSATISIKYSGTVAQWRELIANSAAAYGSGYKFFSGATGNITITCSDGNVRYNSNGVEQ